MTLPRGASDAALAPYHVDRSKLFVMDRLTDSPLLDAERVARAVEFTRFPMTRESSGNRQEDGRGRLVQAADLIGQLGDPLYLKKANALFHEFEEIGVNRESSAMTRRPTWSSAFPDFYWTRVSVSAQRSDRLPERDSQRQEVDCAIVQQYLQCRAQGAPCRTAALKPRPEIAPDAQWGMLIVGTGSMRCLAATFAVPTVTAS